MNNDFKDVRIKTKSSTKYKDFELWQEKLKLLKPKIRNASDFDLWSVIEIGVTMFSFINYIFIVLELTFFSVK